MFYLCVSPTYLFPQVRWVISLHLQKLFSQHFVFKIAVLKEKTLPKFWCLFQLFSEQTVLAKWKRHESRNKRCCSKTTAPLNGCQRNIGCFSCRIAKKASWYAAKSDLIKQHCVCHAACNRYFVLNLKFEAHICHLADVSHIFPVLILTIYYTTCSWKPKKLQHTS